MCCLPFGRYSSEDGEPSLIWFSPPISSTRLSPHGEDAQWTHPLLFIISKPISCSSIRMQWWGGGVGGVCNYLPHLIRCINDLPTPCTTMSAHRIPFGSLLPGPSDSENFEFTELQHVRVQSEGEFPTTFPPSRWS